VNHGTFLTPFSANDSSQERHTEETAIQQKTRHARRLYFGGIPAKHTDEEIFKTFLNAVISLGLNQENDHSYVISVYINPKKYFAFVELKSVELATACLDLDGLVYLGSVLRVHRANEYKPELMLNQTQNRLPLKLNFSPNALAKMSSMGIPSAVLNPQGLFTQSTLGQLMRPGTIQAVESGMVVVVGFPYDEGVRRAGGRLGTANGPKVIRRILRKILNSSNPEFGVDLSTLPLMDLGDVPIGLSLEDAHSRLALVITEVCNRGGLPIIYGGGKDLITATCSGILSAVRSDLSLNVVNIDSSMNCVRDTSDPARISTSNACMSVLQDPRFSGSKGQFFSFGCQGVRCSKEEHDFLKSKGGSVLWLTKDLRHSQVLAQKFHFEGLDTFDELAISTHSSRPAPAHSRGSRLTVGERFRGIIEQMHSKGSGDNDESPGEQRARTYSNSTFDSSFSAGNHLPSPLGVTQPKTGSNSFLYANLSVESMSGTVCPGCSTISSDGFGADEALEICRVMGTNPHVSAFSISDFAPDIEEQRSGRFLADLVHAFITGVAIRLARHQAISSIGKGPQLLTHSNDMNVLDTRGIRSRGDSNNSLVSLGVLHGPSSAPNFLKSNGEEISTGSPSNYFGQRGGLGTVQQSPMREFNQSGQQHGSQPQFNCAPGPAPIIGIDGLQQPSHFYEEGHSSLPRGLLSGHF
jgi:arginase family enzyme